MYTVEGSYLLQITTTADEQDLDLLAAYVVLVAKEKKRRQRDKYGSKIGFFLNEFRPYPDEVSTILHMEKEVYTYLLKLVGPKFKVNNDIAVLSDQG